MLNPSEVLSFFEKNFFKFIIISLPKIVQMVGGSTNRNQISRKKYRPQKKGSRNLHANSDVHLDELNFFGNFEKKASSNKFQPRTERTISKPQNHNFCRPGLFKNFPQRPLPPLLLQRRNKKSLVLEVAD